MVEMEKIPVVIMAGGCGKRVQHISSLIPKPLMGYEGKTLIENVIEVFEKEGCKKFYILLNYKSDLIKAYLESLHLDVDIVYVVEDKPYGTVGGIKLLENCISGTFILCNADNLGKFQYKELVSQHEANNRLITVPVKKIEIRIPFGIIKEENGQFESISEKPTQTISISTGIHILDSQIFDFLGKEESIDMPDLLNSVRSKGKIKCVDISGDTWIDMAEELLKVTGEK